MSVKEKYADSLMDTTPGKYDELDDRHRKILEIFSHYKCKRILDVGCADGNFSILLKEVCDAEEIYGVEISGEGVKSAKRNEVKAFQLNIDEGNFPFEDSYFDGIFAGEVIEHLYDPDHLLEECYRVLSSDGIFILTTRNLSSLYNRITLLLGYQPFPTSVSLKHNVGRMFELSQEILGDHIRVFTHRAMRELLNVSNFKIIETKGTSSVLPRKKSLFLSMIRLMDRALSKFPSLSQGIIFTCRKEL